MLPTNNQLSLGFRINKTRRNRVAAFEGAPCVKVLFIK